MVSSIQIDREDRDRGPERTDDRVAATDLLEELAGRADENSAKVLSRPIRKEVALALASLALESVGDNLSLEDDRLGVHRRGLERCNDSLRFNHVALGNEPTRRLWEPDDHDVEDDGKNTLQG